MDKQGTPIKLGDNTHILEDSMETAAKIYNYSHLFASLNIGLKALAIRTTTLHETRQTRFNAAALA